MRGWAALMVVCFHMIWETFGAIEPSFRSPITGIFLRGPLAVAIFFVLSGEALSLPFFRSGRSAVYSLAIKRYPRLVVPILFNSLIIWVILHLKLNVNEMAGDIVNRHEWLGKFDAANFKTLEFVRFSLLDVFTHFPDNAGRSVDPFLWTMRIEMIGSIVVFVTLYVLCNRMYGYVYLIGAFVVSQVLFHMNHGVFGFISCFLAGILLARLRCSRVYQFLIANIYCRIISGFGFVVVFVITGIFFPFRYETITATVIVFLVSISKEVSALATSRLSLFLGKISFPLFLVQFPVIITFTSWLIVYTGEDHVRSVAPLIAFLSIGVTIVAAILFEPVETITRMVEKKTLSGASFIALALRVGGTNRRAYRTGLARDTD